MTNAENIEDVQLPPIDDTIEIENPEEFVDSPEFKDAVRRAQEGQFDHTLFEMWADMLAEAIHQTEQGISMPLADGLLRQWPWLRYLDLPEYVAYRRTYLQKAKQVLEAAYPKPAELLFLENEDDFELHKEGYIDVIVGWTRLSNELTAMWDTVPLKDRKKGVIHAAVADVSAFLINPNNGLVEYIKNLAHFEMTEEEGAAMIARINGASDE